MHQDNIMNIFDLIDEQYNDKEYSEIKKLVNIKNQNLIILDNLKTVVTAYNNLLGALKHQLSIKNKEIDDLNCAFLENNRMFGHTIDVAI